MNTYEAKQEERKNGYLAKAEKLYAEANNHATQAKEMSEVIPFGQPIHVGTSGERADRNFRDKIAGHLNKAATLQEKAKYYEEKAESVGTGGISSYDDDAIQKLEKKLNALQTLQDRMKTANAALRIKDEDKANAKLKEAGWTDEQIKELRTPNYYGKIGFMPYELTNNNAKIKSVQKRIEELKAKQNREPMQTETDLYKLIEEEGRYQFIFSGKPEEAIRNILKHHGFKWSPSRSAWVRMANANGLYAVKRIEEELKNFTA